MTRFAVEPITFVIGMALVFIGVAIAPNPNAVWTINSFVTYSIGQELGLAGWFVVFLSLAIGTSRATRNHSSDSSAA